MHSTARHEWWRHLPRPGGHGSRPGRSLLGHVEQQAQPEKVLQEGNTLPPGPRAVLGTARGRGRRAGCSSPGRDSTDRTRGRAGSGARAEEEEVWQSLHSEGGRATLPGTLGYSLPRAQLLAEAPVHPPWGSHGSGTGEPYHAAGCSWPDARPLLPLYDVADLFHGAEEFAEVLSGRRASPCCCWADLKLPQIILQLVDGLTESKFVPHLLDGVHIAHAECIEVFARFQHGTVAGHLLGVLGDGKAQGLCAIQDHALGDGTTGDPLRWLAGLPKRHTG